MICVSVAATASAWRRSRQGDHRGRKLVSSGGPGTEAVVQRPGRDLTPRRKRRVFVAAVQLRESIDNEWFLGIAGLASVLFGLLLFVFPGPGALGLLWLIGVYAVHFGALMIALGVRLRRMGAAGATVEIGGPGAAQPVA